MTAKEKAIELFDRFYIEVLDRDGTSAMSESEAKQCVLIAVDEIMKHNSFPTMDYWEEVKQEINVL